MRSFATAITLFLITAAAHSAERYWNTADYLNRRTCPSTSCGVVGRLFYREYADVFEVKDGWARISNRYDAACRGGRSDYVDSGNAHCSAANGIVNGQFAEWVALRYLSRQRPPDPGAGATGTAALVSQSDDYRKHGPAFVKAAETLIGDGRCTAADFKEMGGWLKSTNHRSRPIYFTYCGGMTRGNRLYLDASTGRVFR